jgi:hypothetical protein
MEVLSAPVNKQMKPGRLRLFSKIRCVVMHSVIVGAKIDERTSGVGMIAERHHFSDSKAKKLVGC